MGMQEHKANFVVVHCMLGIIVSLWKYHFVVTLRAREKSVAAALSSSQLAQNHKYIVLTARPFTRSRAVKQN